MCHIHPKELAWWPSPTTRDQWEFRPQHKSRMDCLYFGTIVPFPVAPGWHETLVGNRECRTKPLFATIAFWVDPSCTVVGALASENDTILWEIWYRISSIKSVVFALFCSENNHWVHNGVSSHATNWVIVLIIVKPALKIIEIRQTNKDGEVRFSGEALLPRPIFQTTW